MAEEDLNIPSSTHAPYVEAQQVDRPSIYHSFEFVTVNLIPGGKNVPRAKLSRRELMIGRYIKDHQYEAGTGWSGFRPS